MAETNFFDVDNEEERAEKLTEIINKITADMQHYDEFAKERYDNASADYHGQRVFKVKDADGNTVDLEKLNDSKNFIKRVAGLVGGAKDNVNVWPRTLQDEDYAEQIRKFVLFELKQQNFQKLKLKGVNDEMTIGNLYIATTYDENMINPLYDSVGVIRNDILPYHEVRLDANSRNASDKNSPYYRNREFRIRTLPVSELRLIARNAGHDWYNEIGAYNEQPASNNDFNRTSSDPDSDEGILIDYEFRELQETGDGNLFYQYYTCSIINNNPRFLLKEIQRSPINEYMIEVIAQDDRDDTPYNSGYFEETEDERRLEAEVYTAELKAMRNAIQYMLIFRSNHMTQSKLNKLIRDGKKGGVNAIALKQGDSVDELVGRPVSPIFQQAKLDLRERKENKGGEFEVQRGQQPFSTTSGRLANILNSRSDLGRIELINSLESGFTRIVKKFLTLAVKFYNMEMIIPEITDQGLGPVNQFQTFRFDEPDAERRIRFDLRITIDLNSDVTRARREQFVANNRDRLSSLDILRLSGAETPEVLHRNWLREQGLLEFAEFVEQVPNALELFRTIQSQFQTDQLTAQNAQSQFARNGSTDVA